MSRRRQFRCYGNRTLKSNRKGWYNFAMSWKRAISWVMGLLLVCSAPLASTGQTYCQSSVHGSCCYPAVSNKCCLSKCSASAACHSGLRQSKTETATLRDSFLLAASGNADLTPRMLHDRIAFSDSTLHVRLHSPLQNSSGFNPLLVSLQV